MGLDWQKPIITVDVQELKGNGVHQNSQIKRWISKQNFPEAMQCPDYHDEKVYGVSPLFLL